MTGEYDRERVSETLRESAKLAEWFYKSHLQNGLQDTNAAYRRDELLVRMLVYKHLDAGNFAQSREQLLAELRFMLRHERPLAPRNALDPGAFARYRTKLLQSLLQTHEATQSGGRAA